MDKGALHKEIVELQKISSQWSRTRVNKNEANDLITNIEIFDHTFSVDFPNSVEYYRRNGFAEKHIKDAIFELKSFAKSNLKQKDNHFFYEGMQHLKRGIENLTRNLQKEIGTE